ncbi:MAG: hypothetical protein RH946_00635 [Rhodospirillales bacterium]
MSRKKPNKVYCVITIAGPDLYVLARHAKGARSVAEAHGHEAMPGKDKVSLVGDEYADQAINREKAR